MPSPYRRFLSTPSARRATQHRSGQAAAERISIHALREEGDRIRHGPAGREVYFYPRPPRGGRRLRPAPEHACGLISIHALREEGDAHKTVKENRKAYFYPRPPRGGRHLESVMLEQTDIDFYPRPPRGGRPTKEVQSFAAAIFLSTPSARRATVAGQAHSIRAAISIHALREEGDCPAFHAKVRFCRFLSTPSARRATACG